MEFCKECGSKLKPGARFCPECGTDLHKQDGADNRKGKSDKGTDKWPKKKKVIVSLAIMFAILLIAAYQAGNYYYSEKRLIEQFEEALAEGDASKVAGILTSGDKQLVLTEDNVKPLLSYYEEYPEQIQEEINQLEMQAAAMETNYGNGGIGTDTGMVKLERKGKVLLFDRYQLTVDPVYAEISTNYKDTLIYVDGEKVGKSTSEDDTDTYGPLVPGIHKIKTALKTEYVDLVSEESVVLESGKETFNMDLNGADITIETGIEGDILKGSLLINGEDVGFDPFKNKTFGPVLTDGSMTASVKAEFPWGSMTTEEETITGSYLNVSFAEDAGFQEAIMDVYVQHNEEWLEAYTSGNLDKLSVASEKMIADVQDSIDVMKELDGHFKGKYLKSIFDKDSFELYEEDGSWYVTFSVKDVFDSASYYGGITVEMTEQENILDVQMTYDERQEKWLVDSSYQSWFFNDDDIEERTEENPKTYETSW